MRRLMMATAALFLVGLGVSAQGPGGVQINVYQGRPVATLPAPRPVLEGPRYHVRVEGPPAYRVPVYAGSGCYGSQPRGSGCISYQAGGCQGYQAGAGCYGAAAFAQPAPYGAKLAPGVYNTPSGRMAAPGYFSEPGAAWPYDGPIRRGLRAAMGYDR